MLRFVFHIILHFAVPAMVAYIWYRPDWRRAFWILLSGLLIDLDHLLADPITDPERCSLGFHPLHTLPAVLVYVGMAAYPKTRLWGIGLLIHIALDGLDCLWMG